MSVLPTLDELAAFFGDDIDIEKVKETIDRQEKPVTSLSTAVKPKPPELPAIPKKAAPPEVKPTPKPKPPELPAAPKIFAVPEAKPRAVAPPLKRTAAVSSSSRTKPKPPTPPVSPQPTDNTAKPGWIVMTLQPL